MRRLLAVEDLIVRRRSRFARQEQDKLEQGRLVGNVHSALSRIDRRLGTDLFDLERMRHRRVTGVRAAAPVVAPVAVTAKLEHFARGRIALILVGHSGPPRARVQTGLRVGPMRDPAHDPALGLANSSQDESSVPERDKARILEAELVNAHLGSHLAATVHRRGRRDRQGQLGPEKNGLASTVRSLQAGLEAGLQSVHLVRSRHRAAEQERVRQALEASLE